MFTHFTLDLQCLAHNRCASNFDSGGGNGNPSVFLPGESHGQRQATVLGLAKSRTQLSDLGFSTFGSEQLQTSG